MRRGVEVEQTYEYREHEWVEQQLSFSSSSVPSARWPHSPALVAYALPGLVQTRAIPFHSSQPCLNAPIRVDTQPGVL